MANAQFFEHFLNATRIFSIFSEKLFCSSTFDQNKNSFLQKMCKKTLKNGLGAIMCRFACFFCSGELSSTPT
jgi:hypothetical protein